MNDKVISKGRALDIAHWLYYNMHANKGQKLVSYNKLCDFIKQQATPTEQEVCKALSEHFKETVAYNSVERKFYFVDGNRKGGYITGSNTYHNTYAIAGYALPPHLITLIGRFYEGVNENE